MKRKLFALVSVFSCLTAFSQVIPSDYNTPPDWKKIFSFGGNGQETVIKMDKDSEGNLYIMGHFYGETTMDSITLDSEGVNSNMYLAKFNGDGTLEWVRQSEAQVNGDVRGYDFQLHGAYIYVVGSFVSGDGISGIELTGNGNPGYFVAKYELSGSLVSVQEITIPSTDDNPKGTPKLTVTDDEKAIVALRNKIYGEVDAEMVPLKTFDENLILTDILLVNNATLITGVIEDTVTLDTILLEYSDFNTSLFYASLDQNLQTSWAFNMEQPSNQYPKTSGLARLQEKNNEFYLIGVTSKSSTIHNLSIPEVPSTGDDAILYPFMMKFDPSNGMGTAVREFAQGAYNVGTSGISSDDLLEFWPNENNALTFYYRSSDRQNIKSVNTILLSNQLDSTITVLDLSEEEKHLYEENEEYIKASIDKESLYLSISRISASQEVWKKEFISENGDNSNVSDLVSDKENYYYALLKDARDLDDGNEQYYKLAKFDYENNEIWSRAIEGKFKRSYGIGEQISFSNQTIVLAGYVNSDIKIGDSVFTTTDAAKDVLFVVRFTETGEVINHVMLTPEESEMLFFDVVSLDNNKVLVCQRIGRQEAEIMLLDQDLTLEKSERLKSSNTLYILDGTKANDGRIYLVGELIGDSATYGETVLDKPNNDITKNGINVFLKLDENLNLLEIFNYGHSQSNTSSWPCSIACDGDGNKYVTGWISKDNDYLFGDIIPVPDSRGNRFQNYIAKINNEGDFVWVNTIGSSYSIYNYSSIDTDQEGGLYISFPFRDKLYLNENIELDANYEGSYNSCVVKYNSEGVVQWIKTMASLGRSNTAGVAVANNGDVALGGYFRNLGTFKENLDITAKGSRKGFLATIEGEELLTTDHNFVIDKNMKVYPNPSFGHCTIHVAALDLFQEEVYVQVMDLQGKIYFSKTKKVSSDFLTINVNNYAKGVYLITLSDGANTYTNKLVLH